MPSSADSLAQISELNQVFLSQIRRGSCLNSQVMPLKKTTKSKGTAMAAKIRAKTNRLGDHERERLMGRALELIYKGGQGKVCARSR